MTGNMIAPTILTLYDDNVTDCRIVVMIHRTGPPAAAATMVKLFVPPKHILW
jgi:hypothetical protein